MDQAISQDAITTRERLSRRRMLTLAGLGALIPGATLLARLTGRPAPTPAALPVETAPPLEVLEALPRFAGAGLVGRRAFVRSEGGSETPAAYLYFHVAGQPSWREITSFYARSLPSLGWAVRRNEGKQGGVGFSRGGYSGFLASTTITNEKAPATYYLFLGALA